MSRRRKLSRLISLIGDHARAGNLPQSFQWPLRTRYNIPRNYDHDRRAVGIVIGLPPSLRDSVCAAYPDWDLAFVPLRTDPDEIVRECARLGATAIAGLAIRRRHLVALRAADVNVLWLSHAPLPLLISGTRHARGFTLEESGRWFARRQANDFDHLYGLRRELVTPKLRVDALKIARQLAVPADQPVLLVIGAQAGPFEFPAEQIEPLKELTTKKGLELVQFAVPQWNFWRDDVLVAYYQLLQRSFSVVSASHPLATASTFMNFVQHNVETCVQPSALMWVPRKTHQFVDVPPAAETVDRIAIAVLLLSRYSYNGKLVDPCEFLLANA